MHRLAVDAAWAVTRLVAERSLIPQRSGVVVFVGFSPRRGIPGFAHAAAARAALENLASGLSLEWSRFGIRIGLRLAGDDRDRGARPVRRRPRAVGARRFPCNDSARRRRSPRVIAFLCSPGGAYVTGTTVVVDGGADAWGQAELPPPLEP